MIEQLRRMLKEHLVSEKERRDDEWWELQLATATLLMEVARADERITEDERRDISRLIGKHYSLAPELTLRIAAAAERQAQDATSLYPFTRLINRSCSPEEKVRLVSMLWQVTCSDGHVDKYEEHLVRKIAELLHVPHREFIRMKLKAFNGDTKENPRAAPDGV